MPAEEGERRILCRGQSLHGSYSQLLLIESSLSTPWIPQRPPERRCRASRLPADMTLPISCSDWTRRHKDTDVRQTGPPYFAFQIDPRYIRTEAKRFLQMLDEAASSQAHFCTSSRMVRMRLHAPIHVPWKTAFDSWITDTKMKSISQASI
jgi:hypothetical protein